MLDVARQHFQAGRFEDAEKAAKAVLARDPRDANALELLGASLQARGQSAEALRAFDAAIVVAPRAAILHLRRALALRALGRNQDALTALQRATVLDPNLAEAHHQLGNVLKRLGRNLDALPSLLAATKLAPTNATMWLNLGVAQLELAQRRDAIASFRRATELAPAIPEAHNILGVALLDDGRIAEAEAALRTALQHRPDFAAAHDNLGRTYRAQAKLKEAIAEYRAALKTAASATTHSNLLYALNLAAEVSPEEIAAEHREWGRRYAEPLAQNGKSREVDRSPGRKLRVGFVSPDFVNHAVAYFFEPLLAHRDRNEWEVFCYSDAAVPDRVTQRLSGLSDHWRDTSIVSDQNLDEIIRSDAIDVLVDLAGHTAHHRLLVFARKPAPVQVTWLGYPNTTGLTAIDYRITDAISDPPGDTDRWHTEKLRRMPRAFSCYQPPMDSPAVAPLPAVKAGCVMFGSFSNIAKVSEPCIALWAKVLNRVPGSHLLLKSRGLGDETFAARLRGEFRKFGIAAERIELDANLVSTSEHLRGYERVDIALDPFPYNGTTTTCEALWMGVPVVTLEGKTHVARVGASLLTRLGRPEWIAKTRDAYVERAVSLAADLERLKTIRGELRSQMAGSALCDAAGFAQEMAAAVREMWRGYCG